VGAGFLCVHISLLTCASSSLLHPAILVRFRRL
jgi:hypothetical protein